MEESVEGNEVVYCMMKAPWPVASRDFLQWRRTVVHEETGDILIIHRSASHPDVPPKPGVIRAETLISGREGMGGHKLTVYCTALHSSCTLLLSHTEDCYPRVHGYAVLAMDATKMSSCIPTVNVTLLIIAYSNKAMPQCANIYS